MKALISTNEPRETGYRVAQVSSETFPVAEQLFWVDCSDEIQADVYWYNPETTSFVLTPEPVAPEPKPQPVGTGTQTL